MNGTQTPRALLKQRIDELEAELLDHKLNYNNTAPANYLPAEIICQIFHIIADSAPPSPDSYLGWIKSATHVCHRWREIALGDAKLWSNVRGGSPGVIECMFSRSKDLPVNIDVRFSDSSPTFKSSISQLFSSHHHRLRSVSLEGNFDDDFIIFPTTSSATILEHIYLKSSNSHLTHQLRSQFLPTAGAPALEHLELENFYPPTNGILPLGHKLTHLEIWNTVDAAHTDRVSPAVFMQLLRHLPLLEVLSLSHSLPAILADPPVWSQRTILPLPCLRKASFTDFAIIMVLFLEAVRIPSSAKLSIEVPHLMCGETRVSRLISALGDSWNGFELKIQELECHILPRVAQGNIGLRLRLFHRNTDLACPDADSDLEVLVHQILYDHTSASWITTFTEAFDTSEMRSLTIENSSDEDDSDIKKDFWLDMVGPLQKLETITLDGYYCEPLIDAFLEASKNPSKEPTLFPKLTSVKIKYLYLADEYRDPLDIAYHIESISCHYHDHWEHLNIEFIGCIGFSRRYTKLSRREKCPSIFVRNPDPTGGDSGEEDENDEYADLGESDSSDPEDYEDYYDDWGDFEKEDGWEEEGRDGGMHWQ